MKIGRSELLELLHASLIGAGVAPDQARRAASDALRRFAQLAGGQRVYVPIPNDQRDQRNRAIHEARARNPQPSLAQLARTFGMSKSGIHAVLEVDPSELMP